jgi:threonine-phosphate decarboxylase
VVGQPQTISALRRHGIPWSVSSVAERAAALLSHCGQYEQSLRELIAAERRRISNRLTRVVGIHLFSSTANFFLARWCATEDLDDLLRALLVRGLYVRDCRNFPGLEDGYFRFCIRRPDENDRLLDALEGCCRG